MAETIPRWHLPAVEFLETDAETIQAEIITGYEEASGRTLAAGDPVRLYLLSLATVIIQQRTAVNMAGQQNLLSYAQDSHRTASQLRGLRRRTFITRRACRALCLMFLLLPRHRARSMSMCFSRAANCHLVKRWSKSMRT